MTKGVDVDVSNGLDYGIRVLATKGFKGGISVTYDNEAGTTYSTYTFQGWDKATGSYNSTKGTEGYQKNVTNQQKNATSQTPANYK